MPHARAPSQPAPHLLPGQWPPASPAAPPSSPPSPQPAALPSLTPEAEGGMRHRRQVPPCRSPPPPPPARGTVRRRPLPGMRAVRWQTALALAPRRNGSVDARRGSGGEAPPPATQAGTGEEAARVGWIPLDVPPAWHQPPLLPLLRPLHQAMSPSGHPVLYYSYIGSGRRRRSLLGTSCDALCQRQSCSPGAWRRGLGAWPLTEGVSSLETPM